MNVEGFGKLPHRESSTIDTIIEKVIVWIPYPAKSTANKDLSVV